jgi:hypothetical protein
MHWADFWYESSRTCGRTTSGIQGDRIDLKGAFTYRARTIAFLQQSLMLKTDKLVRVAERLKVRFIECSNDAMMTCTWV